MSREKKKLKKKNAYERVLTSLWSIKLHYKFIESSQDRNLMLTLNAKVEGKGKYTGSILPGRTKDDIPKICYVKCYQHLI